MGRMIATLDGDDPAVYNLPAAGPPADGAEGEIRPAGGTRRAWDGTLPEVALSLLLHAAVLACVMIAAANPFSLVPPTVGERFIRVSLVTVAPEAGSGADASPAREVRGPVAERAVTRPVSSPPAERITAVEAPRSAPVARQPAETGITMEPAGKQPLPAARNEAATGDAVAVPAAGAAAGDASAGRQQPYGAGASGVAAAPSRGTPGPAHASVGAPEVERFTDARPRYRENRSPVYPGTARQRGYEGDVLIAAEVRADGRVGSVRVRRSSGYASLDAAALDAVRVWRFEPARRLGIAVAAWVEIPIRFQLTETDPAL